MEFHEKDFWICYQNRDHKFQQGLLDKQDKLSRDLLSKQELANSQLFDKQSTLTRELHKKHAKLSIISIIAGLSGVALGALITTCLSPPIRVELLPTPQQISQMQSQNKPEFQTSLPHKETSEKEVQAAVASTNASTPNPTMNQTTKGGVESNKAVTKKRGE